jgi:hypothetical protein
MAIFSLSVRSSGTTSPNNSLEIIASTSLGYRLLEVGTTINAATASVFGLGTPGATGVTPTTPVTVLGEDAGNTTAGNSNTALAWATQPTAPTSYYRRVSLPATIGSGIIWTFPRGIQVLKTKSLVLANITVVSAADIWIVVDE